MFQAGCTTMAAWANAANCAILADAFRISKNDSLCTYYTQEATKAFQFATRQENKQLDDTQDIGSARMRGRDFRQMAAAFLYNVTGRREWEDIFAQESMVKGPQSPIFDKGRNAYYQIWACAAYLTCPQERHYPQLYANIKSSVDWHADENNIKPMAERPSRRAANDARWQTSENLHLPRTQGAA